MADINKKDIQINFLDELIDFHDSSKFFENREKEQNEKKKQLEIEIKKIKESQKHTEALNTTMRKESFTNLMINSTGFISEEEFKKRISHTPYIPLDILECKFESNVSCNCFTIGIITKISELKKTKQNTSYMRAQLTNFQPDRKGLNLGLIERKDKKGSDFIEIGLFLFEDAASKFKFLNAGTIIAIMHPQSMSSTQDYEFAVSIKFADFIILLGTSTDFDLCHYTNSYTNKKCYKFINKSIGIYCSKHMKSTLNSERKAGPRLENEDRFCYVDSIVPIQSLQTIQNLPNENIKEEDSKLLEGNQELNLNQEPKVFSELTEEEKIKAKIMKSKDSDNLTKFFKARKISEKTYNLSKELYHSNNAFADIDYHKQEDLLEIESAKKIIELPSVESTKADQDMIKRLMEKKKVKISNLNEESVELKIKKE